MSNAAAPDGFPPPALASPGQRLPMGGQAASWLALGAGTLAVAAFVLGARLGLDRWFFAGSAALYCAIAIVMIFGLGHHPHARFGAANGVTVLRSAITALVGGLLLEVALLGAPAASGWAWWFAGLAFLSVALDGFDGYLARRQGLASRFGARFDMEVDALLILFLAALAHLDGKAGPLILAVGLMRYAFVVAAWTLPFTTRELPASFRRKAVCVVQGVVLGLLILPFMRPPVSETLAAFAFATLAGSFLVDIAWLWRHRRAAR